jgi:hypothetical protein
MGDEHKDSPLPLSPRARYLARSPKSSLVPKTRKQIRLNQIRKSFEKPRSITRHSANKRSTKKSKKSARKTFYAANAYTILGHGSEGNSTFILPANCMVITLAHPGEITYTDVLYEYFQMMATMDMNILLNPLEHMTELTKHFEPLTYYMPGSKCPDFRYTLAGVYKTKLENANGNKKSYYEACDPGSGVVNIADLQKEKLHNKYGIVISKDTINTFTNEDITDSIMHQYRNSLWPRKNLVERIIDHDIIDTLELSEEEPYEKYQFALERLYASRNVIENQSFLTNMLPPGVYYNFVCRDISSIRNILYTNNVENLKTIPYLKAKHREGNDRYRQAVNVIGQRIANFSRKAQARNLYTSNDYKKRELLDYNSQIEDYTLTIPEEEERIRELHDKREKIMQFINMFNEGNEEYDQVQEEIAQYDKQIDISKKRIEKSKKYLKRLPKEKASVIRRFASMKKSPRRKHRRHSAH